MIYLISGKFRVGKDTASIMIAKACEERNLKPVILQIAFYIKEYAKKISDWDGNEETKPRKFLQTLGTDIIGNTIDKQLFVRRINEDIKVYSKYFDIIIISDVRLINEIEQIKKANDDKVVTIRILRDTKIKSNNKHQTETELDNYEDFDYVIDNNGTLEELNSQIKEIVEKEK